MKFLATPLCVTRKYIDLSARYRPRRHRKSLTFLHVDVISLYYVYDFRSRTALYRFVEMWARGLRFYSVDFRIQTVRLKYGKTRRGISVDMRMIFLQCTILQGKDACAGGVVSVSCEAGESGTWQAWVDRKVRQGSTEEDQHRREEPTSRSSRYTKRTHWPFL